MPRASSAMTKTLNAPIASEVSARDSGSEPAANEIDGAQASAAPLLDLTPDAWSHLLEASHRVLAKVTFRPDHQPDFDTFVQRMTRYAQGGFTFDLEENEASIRCVAAPVRDASGAIVAALSVASTIPYMPSERMEELIPVVQRQARAISEELGWRVPQPVTRRIKR